MNCGKTSITKDVSCLLDFPESLQNSIKNIIKGEGYINYEVRLKVQPFNGSLLGSFYEIDIIGETVNGKTETPLLIKKSITLEKITFGNVSDFFSRELFIYNDLSKVFMRLQDNAKVPKENRFNILKTYESTKQAIFMENLARKGFKTYHRSQVVPIKFAELSIVELAKIHALSFVIKEKDPKFFKEKIETIQCPFNFNNDWRGFVENMCVTAASVLEGEVKSKIETYASRLCQLFKKYVSDTISPYGCVCHGDYKILNILVKEVDGEAVEVCPIDYQLIYYGNPVDDFLFFMFTGTDKEFRRKHLNYLKELYFESFAKFLRYFGMEVQTTYPREAFEKDYEERLELGLVFGLYLSVITFVRFDEGFDISKLSLSEFPMNPDEMFGDRVRGIVEDFVEWGYL